MVHDTAGNIHVIDPWNISYIGVDKKGLIVKEPNEEEKIIFVDDPDKEKKQVEHELTQAYKGITIGYEKRENVL